MGGVKNTRKKKQKEYGRQTMNKEAENLLGEDYDKILSKLSEKVLEVEVNQGIEIHNIASDAFDMGFELAMKMGEDHDIAEVRYFFEKFIKETKREDNGKRA